jgi:hypothetical protein
LVVSISFKLIYKVEDVEHFISETIHKLNALTVQEFTILLADISGGL